MIRRTTVEKPTLLFKIYEHISVNKRLSYNDTSCEPFLIFFKDRNPKNKKNFKTYKIKAFQATDQLTVKYLTKLPCLKAE